MNAAGARSAVAVGVAQDAVRAVRPADLEQGGDEGVVGHGLDDPPFELGVRGGFRGRDEQGSGHGPVRTSGHGVREVPSGGDPARDGQYRARVARPYGGQQEVHGHPAEQVAAGFGALQDQDGRTPSQGQGADLYHQRVPGGLDGPDRVRVGQPEGGDEGAPGQLGQDRPELVEAGGRAGHLGDHVHPERAVGGNRRLTYQPGGPRGWFPVQREGAARSGPGHRGAQGRAGDGAHPGLQQGQFEPQQGGRPGHVRPPACRTARCAAARSPSKRSPRACTHRSRPKATQPVKAGRPS